jgi:hypothetical protein
MGGVGPLLVIGGVAFLFIAVGAVLFWGAEALSLVILYALVDGDEGLAGPDDGWGNSGLPPLEQIRNTEGLSLLARVGLRRILWLVDRLEGRRPITRRLLWSLAQALTAAFLRMGTVLDGALRRPAPERSQRRLGRRLLYEMVAAHRA